MTISDSARTLIKLYADGLIEARDDPDHGRIRRIFLTRRGKQLTVMLQECIAALRDASSTDDE